MPRKSPAIFPLADAGPALRRMYADCRYGQLHLRTALPANGGFDEQTTLVCLHQSPMSSRTFIPFVAEMGRDRSVYAPDTPGYGESDAPPSQPTVHDYAQAIGDFLQGMRFRQVDLLGYHTGSAIAAELAIANPQLVRRLVLVALPVFNETERAAFDAKPWPTPVREDGSHLAEEWQRTLQWRGPGVDLPGLARSFAEKLRSGPQGHWGAHAAVHWPAAKRLPQVTQPVLVMRPRDDLWDVTPRAQPLLPSAQWHDLPDYGFGLFDVATPVVAQRCREFLDAPTAPG